MLNCLNYYDYVFSLGHVKSFLRWLCRFGGTTSDQIVYAMSDEPINADVCVLNSAIDLNIFEGFEISSVGHVKWLAMAAACEFRCDRKLRLRVHCECVAAHVERYVYP
jgi:hypothetical protein